MKRRSRPESSDRAIRGATLVPRPAGQCKHRFLEERFAAFLEGVARLLLGTIMVHSLGILFGWTLMYPR